jgi:acyl-coenzyme A synthetase/AMP-(fatty) acid ligase
VVAWIGVLWAGGTAVGVNPRLSAGEWGALQREAGFAFVLHEDDDAQPGEASPQTHRISLAAWHQAVLAATPTEAQPMQRDAPAFWVFSSGTSGRPKAVVHAQRSIRGIERIARERLGFTPRDRLLASSRLFFTYPLVNGLLSGLRAGATLLIDPQWPDPARFAERIGALAPTVVFSVPSMYRDLLHEGLAARLRGGGIRLCVSAGEVLPAALREAWWGATGVPMFDGYGASETLTLVLGAAQGEHGALTPSPGVQVRALDAAAAAAGAPTRLVFRAGTLALGYLDQPASRSTNFIEGAFCPADLFVAAGDGWRFAGREDSLVKVHGRWVDLVALEQSLVADVAGVREAAAVAAPDADGVQAIGLFFVADDAVAAYAALARRVARLPRYQRPNWLRALRALPRTPTGKLLRRELRALLAAEEGQP